ncbi:MAG TPA: hypothetical protein VFE11_16210, partial [Dongiaceae bacterium]|nr:hypothetical protein [Dongiaceae bacterium]
DECYLSAAIIYIILSFILTRGFYFAERHLNKDRVALQSRTAKSLAPATDPVLLAIEGRVEDTPPRG